MDIKCTDKESFVFKKIAQAAADLQAPCYLIGGFVRDRLIGRATKDADIVCAGDGIQLAHKVAASLQPKPSVSFFKNFGTAQIKWEDLEIEFVGARKESYRADSRNPKSNRVPSRMTSCAATLPSTPWPSALTTATTACLSTPSMAGMISGIS